MGRLRNLSVILALVLSLVAPAIACALPTAQMTAQEHSCCQKMKGHCGSMGMPASHSCCRPSIEANHFDAIQPKSAPLPSITVVAVLPSAALFYLRSLTYERVSWPQHSPPPSPPPTVSVLRV
jgi:hypothetical protein